MDFKVDLEESGHLVRWELLKEGPRKAALHALNRLWTTQIHDREVKYRIRNR